MHWQVPCRTILSESSGNISEHVLGTYGLPGAALEFGAPEAHKNRYCTVNPS